MAQEPQKSSTFQDKCSEIPICWQKELFQKSAVFDLPHSTPGSSPHGCPNMLMLTRGTKLVELFYQFFGVGSTYGDKKRFLKNMSFFCRLAVPYIRTVL